VSSASIRALGRVAAAARRSGLGVLLRLVRDGADRLLLALGRPPLRVTVDGIELRGFLRHRSFLDHLGRGAYEPFARSLFLDALGRADLVLDVGAHVGYYTLLAADTRPETRIVAVEADPYNAAALAANVRRSGAHVEVVGKAASDTSGRVVFHQNLGTVGSSLVRRPGAGPTREVEVDATTVDALAGEGPLGAVLAKIDVEGAERSVVRGMRETISRAAAVTALVEVNPRALAETGALPSDLVADLAALGLEVSYVDEDAAALVPAERAGKGNLFCRKRS